MDQTTVERLTQEGLRFAYPVRPWDRAKIDSEFLDPDYYATYGTWHRGVDINGVGGGDTDLGWPVQSMFPGTVIDVVDKPGWGNVVLVRSDHWVRDFVALMLEPKRQVDVIDVQYAHLTNVSVKPGDIICAGDHLGGIGKGDNDRYVAHLHLEVRYKVAPAVVYQLGGDEGLRMTSEQCANPRDLLEHLPLADYPSAMGQRRLVAPVRYLEINGEHIEGESVTVVNRLGTKLYLRDERKHRPKTFAEAVALAFRLLGRNTNKT